MPTEFVVTDRSVSAIPLPPPPPDTVPGTNRLSVAFQTSACPFDGVLSPVTFTSVRSLIFVAPLCKTV